MDDLTTKEYEARSLDIANAMAEVVDAEKVRELRDAILEIYNNEDEVVLSDQWGNPEFEDYISDYSEIENTEAFISLRSQLRNVQDVIDVDCLYITWLDTDRACHIYLVDGAYEDAFPPGCVDPLYVENHPVLEDPEVGCAPNVTHTEEYGYLVTTGMPIHTDDGELVGYAAVNLSMNEIVDHENSLLMMAILLFGIITVIVIVFGILFVDRTIVRPINKLSATAKDYTGNEMRFSQLDINTGDEIEALADSMKQMEQNLMATRSDLKTARKDAEEYKREANIDSLTGLRNKRAYDLAIGELSDKPYVIVMIDLNDLKGINDRHGHEKGDVAIRNLASLTCNVFKHSPVFRIGGDEFAVILTGEDYESREGLIGHFRDEVRKREENEGLSPWDQISAACGCAVAMEGEDVSDVFKRADEDMYDRKLWMKKGRASSTAMREEA